MIQNTWNLFIASSKTGAPLVEAIATALAADTAFKVHPWTSSKIFGVAKPILAAFEKQLDHNDFFIFIFTPDLEVHRRGPSVWIPTPNVLLEYGAVWGRYGHQRILAFIAENMDVPPDLAGLHIPRFRYDFQEGFKAGSLNESVVKIVTDIKNGIDHEEIQLRQITKDGKTASDGLRSRWLSLIRTAPSCQDNVLESIIQEEDDAWGRWGVRFERFGVAWGETDVFLLFSGPRVSNSTEFVKHLRVLFGRNILAIDSRMVWPRSFWRGREQSRFDEEWTQLILLSCNVNTVETVFSYIASKAPAPPTPEVANTVEILNAGILMGTHDVFCTIASPKVADMHTFCRAILRYLESHDCLVQNSTSILISKLPERTVHAHS